MKKYSAFFGAVLLFTYTTVAVNIADADLIQPVSYDMLNGQASTYSYWDESYSGSGDPTENYSPLSGGLGDLTDGIIATENWYIVEAPDGPGPYVGWRIDPITITFHFEGAPTINEVTIYVDDANGEGGGQATTWCRNCNGGHNIGISCYQSAGFSSYLCDVFRFKSHGRIA